jgi:hypothetical protein
VTGVDVAAVLLHSSLAGAGWQMVSDGREHMLLRIDHRWHGPVPRIVVRPLDGGRGRLWWHWTAPAPIAGIPIAPATYADQVHRLVCSTLAKLSRATDRGGP